jgi:hypothetical protein
MQLDYMLLADYVRQDAAGAINIMGAGIDTIQVTAVPTVGHLGVAMRISFDSSDQIGLQHEVSLSFVGPDHPVLSAVARFETPPPVQDVPPHWRTGVGVAVQIAVPLPSYGDYSLELAIDGAQEVEARSIDFRVIPPV